MLFLLSSLCLIFFFFFCKQKTAYEWRISDWSSDVCSSDLRLSQGLRPVYPVRFTVQPCSAVSAAAGRVSAVDAIFQHLLARQVAPRRLVGAAAFDRLLLIHDVGQQLARHAHADQEIIVLAREQRGVLLDVAEDRKSVV